MSCLNPESFPPEPQIEFDQFVQQGDSGTLTISFTDGDGDIGLNKADTTGDFDPSNRFHHNLFVEYWEKVDGIGWQHAQDLDGNEINFLYRIPIITPAGNNKALKGTISVVIEPTYYNPFSPDSDTIKYIISLADRSFNESNVVESNEINR